MSKAFDNIQYEQGDIGTDLLKRWSKTSFEDVVKNAEAYQDAVRALGVITNGAPLSTTIGTLIRSGTLVLKEK